MCTNLMISVPSNPGQSPTTPMYVSARALEMPGALAQNAYVVPVNQSWPIAAESPPPEIKGWTTLGWTNQYGFVAVAVSTSWSSIPTFNDGLNTAGLSVGALWLAPDTEYPPVGTAGNQVSFFDFPAWILGKCATIADVENALRDKQIVVVGPPAPTSTQESPFYVPLHYVVTDSSGDSLIIEFIKGAPHIHRSKTGVLTNWPPYHWHETNLKNYFNLTLVGAGTSPTGAGNPVGGGLMGLPGDALSSSRFVKASIMSKGIRELPADGTGWLPAPGALPTMKAPIDFAGPEQTAVTVALSLVQIAMGTPYGMLLQKGTGDESKKIYGDYTMWTCVRDHSNLKYYLLSAFSAALSLIDLSTIDFTSTAGYPNNVYFPILPQPGVAWYVDATLVSDAQRS